MRTPCRGAAADRCAAQWKFMNRTDPSRAPAFVNEPGFRRIGIIVADNAKRFARHETRDAVHDRALRSGEITTRRGGCNLCAPQNFICQPVSNSWKTALH